MTDFEQITALLKRARTIAVVGLSDQPGRASREVAAYLQAQGYRIIPVNPSVQEVLGERSFSSLLEIPTEERVDVVDVFRRSEFVPEIVDQAIQRKIPAVWMQEGVIHEEAAQKARAAGVFVVMNRCMLKEHALRRKELTGIE